ncbi:MAG: alpha/beta hydrolase [Alphaproteobacteria bacterium]|nr:alpha/beta hydrolase [Alphaproteobacteria bacterium]
MAEKFVQNGEISLWTEDFGDASDPTVLLMRGIGGTGVTWSLSFCEFLVKNGYHVIRYDQRDSGLSSYVDYNHHPYRLIDLAADVVCILDSYRVKKAHVIGISMGGFVSQMVAIHFPERVKTLTLFSSTLNFRPQILAAFGISTGWMKLPGPKSDVVRTLKTALSHPDDSLVLTDDDFLVHQYVELAKICNGGNAPFDPQEWKDELDIIRKHENFQGQPYGISNSAHAVAKGPIHIHSEKIRCPVLIIHGSRDPIIPVKHARALAHAIPNAKRIIVYGMGHAISQKYFDEIIDVALVNFLRDSSAETNKPMVHERIATDVCNFWHNLFSVFWHKA